MAILIHNLGYPRMGALRQLKKSLEGFWREPRPKPSCIARRAGCVACIGSSKRTRAWT